MARAYCFRPHRRRSRGRPVQSISKPRILRFIGLALQHPPPRLGNPKECDPNRACAGNYGRCGKARAHEFGHLLDREAERQQHRLGAAITRSS
jgi:hypothetical protein